MKTWLRIVGLKGALALVLLSLLGASGLLFSPAALAASTSNCSPSTKVSILVTFPTTTFQALSIRFGVSRGVVTPTGTGVPVGRKTTIRNVSEVVITVPDNQQSHEDIFSRAFPGPMGSSGERPNIVVAVNLRGRSAAPCRGVP